MAKNEESTGPAAWEWLPVLVWAALLAAWWRRPEGLAGPLVPCLALGLAPGSLCRLAGRRSITAHRIGLAAGLIAYLFQKQPLDQDRWQALAAGWPWVAAGVALTATQPVLGAWRWRTLLAAGNVPVGYGDCLRLGLAGTFFNLAIPGATGGDVLRVGCLARDRGRLGAALASVTLDRFLGLPAQLLVVAAGFALNAAWVAQRPFLAALWPGVAGGTAVLLALPTALAMGAGPLHRWMTRYADTDTAKEADAPPSSGVRAFVAGRADAGASEDVPAGPRPRSAPVRRKMADRWHRRIARGCAKASGVVAVYGGKGGALAAALGIGMLSHLLTVAACGCFGRAAGVADIPATAYLLLVPAGLAVNAIPGAPGGVGQGELAFRDLFERAAPGLGNDAAGLLVMVCLRFALILVGLAGGMVYLTGRHRVGAVPGDQPARSVARPEAARPEPAE